MLPNCTIVRVTLLSLLLFCFGFWLLCIRSVLGGCLEATWALFLNLVFTLPTYNYLHFSTGPDLILKTSNSPFHT